MRTWLVVAVLIVGCRQAAPEIETGAELRCEVQVGPLTPAPLPAPQGEGEGG